MSEQNPLSPLVAQASGTDAERERVHLMLLADAQRGLADVESGRTLGADGALGQLQIRRSQEHGQS
jgi:hypothetical protein